MGRWVDFVYREFYDVPRSIIVKLPDGLLLLECRFLEDADAYADHYDAFLLPPEVDLSGSWTDLSRWATRALGSIAVEHVELDETRRRSLDLESLAPVMATG
ncbi:MAG: hypothetical protein ACM31C_16450 [Acidobacteriota bacterium]